MRALLLPLCAALLLPAAAQAAPDPWEGVNRRVHAFNDLAQTYALAPAAAFWRAQVPSDTREGIGRVVANLGEPVTALSAVAAGDFSRAWNATARFGINATLGWGGWREAAAPRGFERRAMAPGDAACAWGVPSGPYLVLPLLGPSTLRDATAGLAANAALAQGLGAGPVAGWQASDGFLAYERAEGELARVAAQSLDPYAVLRSAWLQRRAASCPGDAAAAEEDTAEAAPR
ncbi:MlaA family lipoprotein [Roseomonas sp. AR75]|uniref:MlaA family lipoprotein n=1 Tax=Roseomonas sp. AR75 TaxID=2562311 RepID=UPI0010C0A017|nr:MlaA family lipoprotein [Roseomonas sp. AR75]